MKKCAVVYNPESGKSSPLKNINNFKSIFEKYGYDFELIPTKCRYDAINIVENMDYVDLVLVAGGDGTLNEAIEGNLRRKNKLLMAQLPFGTQNDVAHMYGLSNNIKKNLELILSGVVKNVDICLINDKPFVYVSCMGAYVDIAYQTPRKLKEKYGRLAYILYGIKQLKQTFHHYNIEYETNGIKDETEFSFIFITNSNRIGGVKVKDIHPDVKLNDNKFEVLLCNVKNRFDIFKALYYLKRREIDNLPGFKYFKTSEFSLEFKDVPGSSWCIDGDEYKHHTSHFDIRITKEINMLVPSKNVSELFEEE